MCGFGNCEETISHPLISLHQGKSQITFLNPERLSIRKVEVDGCAITEGLRCDYLLIEPTTNHEHYIELKGSDVPHALKQIIQTILQLSAEAKTHPKSSYVASTRCPLLSPEIQRHMLKFQRLYNSKLHIKNGKCTVSL